MARVPPTPETPVQIPLGEREHLKIWFDHSEILEPKSVIRMNWLNSLRVYCVSSARSETQVIYDVRKKEPQWNGNAVLFANI